MGLFRKVKHHLKGELKTARKTAFGLKGKWAGNPFTHGAWATKNVVHGLRSGSWRANLAKYTGNGSRHAYDDAFALPMDPGNSWTYSGKNLAALQR